MGTFCWSSTCVADTPKDTLYRLTRKRRSCAAKLVHNYIPQWGCPHTFLSDRGPEFMSTVGREIFRMLATVKRFTSSAPAQTNSMVERLNHILCQMLSHLVADNQTNWDELLLHAIAAHNNSVSRGTGLAPNEVHIGLYPRLPMTILEGRGARGHQGLRRDQLHFLQLIRERQNRAHELMRKKYFLIKAKQQTANEKLNSIFRQHPNFEAGQWVRVYDDKSSASGGDKLVLKAPVDGSTRMSFALASKLAHCWTGPYKVLLVGPGKAPDCDLFGRNLFLLDMSHEDSRRINVRVSVHRCKICYNPHERERRPQLLPWAMSPYLNKYSDLSPHFHLTVDDVNIELDSYRVTPRSIVSHRILRGFSGTVSVQYLTSWNELENTSWETEQDLEQYGNVVELYWAGEQKQVGGENVKHRAYRVQMAKHSQARSVGEVYVPPGNKLSCDSRCGPDMYSPDTIGSYIFFKTADDEWQFAKVIGLAKDTGSVMFPHTIKMLDWGKQFNEHLRRDQLKTPDVSDDPGTWCWHLHLRGSCKQYTYSLS